MSEHRKLAVLGIETTGDEIMKNRASKILFPVALGLLASSTAAALAMDNSASTPKSDRSTTQDAADNTDQQTTASTKESDETDAQSIVDEAVKVVDQMKSQEGMTQLLSNAKGIYIVPDFGRAGLVVGGRGGAGVMLSKSADGNWSNPGFYNFGGISVGAEAGVSAGSIAFVLMTDDAVKEFQEDNSFSLNADAGLSIIDWSANAQASAGKDDIVMWSDTEGAFAGAEISVSDINWSDDNTQAYYGKKVGPADLVSGDMKSGKAQKLKSALES